MRARRHVPFIAGALTVCVACGSPEAGGSQPMRSTAQGATTPRPQGPAAASAAGSMARSGEWFDDVRWQQRLLVVAGPADEVETQLAALREAGAVLLERDLLVIDASGSRSHVVLGARTGAPPSAALRERYDLDRERFTVVLVGLDGGVKERRRETFAPAEIARVIDAMPMRQSELRGR